MRKFSTILFLLFLSFIPVSSQPAIRNFIFGHSLINHEFQVNPTPSQETSVPHWFHFLAEEAGISYAVSGQYGFLPQHQNLPPFSQWGFDVVAPVWESDTDPFSAADFTDILITPGNFIQWQGPDEEYPNDPGITPLSATQKVFSWCQQQEEGLDFYIYENWPDMAPFLGNGFPPSASEWEAYNAELTGGFHTWFLTYHDALVAANPDVCVSMIPVGPLMSSILTRSPYNQIPIDILYEDDAPHGRPSLYFLAAMVTYSAMVGEKVPATFQAPDIIHPLIKDNYVAIGDIIWEELINFKGESGKESAFCQQFTTSVTEPLSSKFSTYPNPTNEILYIDTGMEVGNITIYTLLGQPVSKYLLEKGTEMRVDLSLLPDGIYWIQLFDVAGKEIGQQKIIKIP
ncbi:MAG: T9SS type A sorting domain-containing protein [Bacteroidota bacterium]